MQHSPLLFNAPSDFTILLFFFFSEKRQKIGFPKHSDTETVKEFITLWLTNHETPINSIEMLSEAISGLLILNLQPKTNKKKLQKIMYNYNPYYIVSGTYISPVAKSILQDNPGECIPP